MRATMLAMMAQSETFMIHALETKLVIILDTMVVQLEMLRIHALENVLVIKLDTLVVQ